jgi:ABC-type multidrug transport system fused ATPase/permease subunit
MHDATTHRAAIIDAAPMGRTTFRRLLDLLAPHRGRVALSTLLATAVGAFSAASVGALVPVLDLLLRPDGVERSLARLGSLGRAGEGAADWARAAAGDDRVKALAIVLAALVALTLVKGAIAFSHEVLTGSISERARLALAQRLFDRLTEHDESTLARVGMGNLTARFTYDLDMTGKAIETLIGTIVREGLELTAYLALALALSWQLTLLAVALVPVLLLLARVLGRRIRRSAEGMLSRRAVLLTRVEETVAALPVVQVYGREADERGRFRSLTNRVYAWAMRLARLEATTSPALEVAGVLALVPVVLAGARLVVHGGMDGTSFLVFFAALAAFISPLRKAVGASNRLHGGLAGAERIFATIDLPAEVTESAGATDLPPLAVAVEWRDVVVTYPDGRTALAGVTLHAPAGRTTAFVGPSGSGKTTLLHTLPRLLDPTSGTVLLDGRDIRGARLASLRGRMAIVTQDARLFGGTLAENVAYAKPGATRDEVERAGRAARVDEIVARMPQGWDTLLDEKGAGLSGGERQRIAIARAVLRDPEILLLDEPTSALDPENERMVREALAELSRGRTTIVVTHRPELAAAADHVVLLREGRVEVQGPPASVLAHLGGEPRGV